jgi:hypothetical protein
MVLLQPVGSARIIAQIELAIYDAPRLGVDVRGDRSGRDAVRAISAILRRVPDRLAPEKLAILRACEMPVRAQPVIGEFFRALHGLVLREIGHRIVALDRDVTEIARVDDIFGGR